MDVCSEDAQMKMGNASSAFPVVHPHRRDAFYDESRASQEQCLLSTRLRRCILGNVGDSWTFWNKSGTLRVLSGEDVRNQTGL